MRQSVYLTQVQRSLYTMQHKSTQTSTDIAALLRQLRGDRSQEEFAGLAGVTRAALANYETGRTRPKAKILKEIAGRLGLSPDFLISGQIAHEHDLNILMTGKHIVSECHETDDELAIVSALRAVTPETVKQVVDVLLRQIEEDAPTRERLSGLNTVSDIARLGAIFKAGGHFKKGSSAEEIDAFFASLAKSARS